MTPDRFWVDSGTGERIHLDDAGDHPRAAKSRMWNWFPHPILYMATDLGPILTVLQDRVTRVTCMATRPESYYYEGIPASDIQVALMQTEKDTIIRMAAGFTYATPRDHHWWHLEGTRGKVETARSAEIYGSAGGVDTPKIWLESSGEESMREAEWRYSPEDLPEEARGSGHGNMDYFALSSFLDAILDDSDPPLNVYRSADLTAPAIVAVQSVEQGNACLEVPDFRPSEEKEGWQLSSLVSSPSDAVSYENRNGTMLIEVGETQDGRGERLPAAVEILIVPKAITARKKDSTCSTCPL